MNNNIVGRELVLGKVKKSLSKLWKSIHDFAWSPHEENALYLDKLEQWQSITYVSSTIPVAF